MLDVCTRKGGSGLTQRQRGGDREVWGRREDDNVDERDDIVVVDIGREAAVAERSGGPRDAPRGLEGRGASDWAEV